MRKTTKELNAKLISGTDLLNYGTISRMLSGTRAVIYRGCIPIKHEDKVNELEAIVQKWFDKYKNI